MTQWQGVCLAYTAPEENASNPLPQMKKKSLNSHSVLWLLILHISAMVKGKNTGRCRDTVALPQCMLGKKPAKFLADFPMDEAKKVAHTSLLSDFSKPAK